MASNFWNFRPSDEQQKAAFIARQKAGMQGYAPAPDMNGYTPALAGYSLPDSPAQPQEMQGGVRLPWDAAQGLNKGWIYTQQQEQAAQQQKALFDEYNRNAARIEAIEAELKRIGAEDRNALDNLDRTLAANRAGIGDIGNAQMHLSRIDNRAAVLAGKNGNTDADRVAAEDEIDRLYMMRAEGSPGQQAYYDRAIARKEAEYARKYGKPYGGELAIPTGPQSAGTVSNFQGYDDVLQQELKANGNNGRLSKAQISKLNGILDQLPAGDERNSRKKALDAVVSNEKHAEDVAKQKAKEKEAIAEVRKSVTGWDLKEAGASKTVTAKNGQTVTVTRMSDGSVQYTCGSTKG